MTDRVLTNTYVSDVVDLESPDDLALADRMKVGREQILSELERSSSGRRTSSRRCCTPCSWVATASSSARPAWPRRC